MVDSVLLSERERNPDKLEQLGPLLDEPHLVQPHVRCMASGLGRGCQWANLVLMHESSASSVWCLGCVQRDTP